MGCYVVTTTSFFYVVVWTLRFMLLAAWLQSNIKLWSSLRFYSTKWDFMCPEQVCLWKFPLQILRVVLETVEGAVQWAVRGTNHIREEGGGMFIEADDSLSQLVSPQTIREGPQLPLHLRPWIHAGEQLPERQPVGHTEGSYRTCCSEEREF